MTKSKVKKNVTLYVVPDGKVGPQIAGTFTTPKEACKAGCKVLESKAFDEIVIHCDRGV